MVLALKLDLGSGRPPIIEKGNYIIYIRPMEILRHYIIKYRKY
jgi:hypothetical protein